MPFHTEFESRKGDYFMPEKKEPVFVPARYIGNTPIGLQDNKRDWRNIDGSKRTDLILNNGDTLMMPEEEIIGFTMLEDPHRQRDPLHLGAGRVVLPEHAGKSAEELDALGYVFNVGRSDFRLIEAEAPPAQPLSDEPPFEPPMQVESEVI